jgi:ectoine hydroxylase-related dioxygenase (phytanoyl-CoA dioxygenase family)
MCDPLAGRARIVAGFQGAIMVAPSVSTQSLTAEEIATFHRNGFHVSRQLFSPAEVAEIRDAFMAAAANGPVPGLSEIRHYQQKNAYDPSDPLARYPRMMNPHTHPEQAVGPLSLRYLLDARLHTQLADMLGDEPIAAQTMFYFKPPGARGQDFHQDNFYLRVKPGTCLAAWIAIDDCDEDNGTMMVVPTSNALDIACPEKADPAKFFTTEHVNIPAGMKAVSCILKAGDCLFFNGSIIHGSFPNTSKTRFRRSFICHYIPDSCVEVASYYKPLLRFNGQGVEKAVATGGGPCGSAQDLVTTRH